MFEEEKRSSCWDKFGIAPTRAMSYVQRFDESSKSSSNFPHCGDCRKRGVPGGTVVQWYGRCKDDFDNRNGRQRHEEKEFLIPGAPDVCVSDWLEGLAHIANPFCFLSFSSLLLTLFILDSSNHC